MIFIAKDADFSENSIGTVELPIPTQEETTKIISLFSSKPSSTVQAALNKFIYNIKQAGIYTKLKLLNMPFLAGTVDEAILNVLDGSADMYTGTTSSTTKASSSNLSLSDKALKVVPGATAVNLVFNSISTSNFAIGAFIHNLSEEETGLRPIIFGNSTANYFGFMAIKPGNNTIAINNPSASFSHYGSVTDDIFVGVSLNAGNGTALFGDEKKETSYSEGSVNMSFIKFGIYSDATYIDGSTWAYMRQSLGLFFLSDGMTSTEFSLMKEQVDFLMKTVYAL